MKKKKSRGKTQAILTEQKIQKDSENFKYNVWTNILSLYNSIAKN